MSTRCVCDKSKKNQQNWYRRVGDNASESVMGDVRCDNANIDEQYSYSPDSRQSRDPREFLFLYFARVLKYANFHLVWVCESNIECH